jgi:DNA-binding response OmpR family regulator
MLSTLVSAVLGKPRDAAPEGGSGGETRTVLVVDDDPNLRDLLRLTLTARGYRTLTATNGREGVATARKERPDAIILDGNMPEMDGFEALKRLRRGRGTAETPVVMLTARVREGDVLTGFRCGAQEYLAKPVTVEEVMNSLRMLLER